MHLAAAAAAAEDVHADAAAVPDVVVAVVGNDLAPLDLTKPLVDEIGAVVDGVGVVVVVETAAKPTLQ